MKNLQITPVILIVISGAMIKAALDFPQRAAFASHYVIFLAIILIFLCIITLFKVKKTNIELKEVKKLLFLIISIAFYLLAMEYIGFFATSGVFMISVMAYLGVRNKLTMVVATILTLGGIYLIFSSFLEVPVPSGILF